VAGNTEDIMDEFNIQTLTLSTFAMSFVIYGMIVFCKDNIAHWPEFRADLLQPWKLVTLAIGFSWLLFGALTYDIPDWDVGVSIIMALLTYTSAPWCVRAIVGKRWSLIAGVVIMSWFSIDGSYALWHTLAGNQMIRDANFPASAALYWLCGFIWLPRGSLRDIISFRAQLR
jgi:hypothetical protein